MPLLSIEVVVRIISSRVNTVVRALGRTCARVVSFYREHSNQRLIKSSIAIAGSLYIIYGYLENAYPPKSIGNYVIYVVFSGGHALGTHRYMFPTIYASIIFLVTSLPYLQRKIVGTFEEVRHSMENPGEFSNESVKIACSRHRYLFAIVVGFLLPWGPSIVTCFMLNSFEILYIAYPVVIVIMFEYFLIAFLSSVGLWLILSTTHLVNQAAKQRFKFEIKDPSNWLSDDEMGGFKQLSDISLRIFEFLVLGVLIFSPAVLLYHVLSNMVYFFAIAPISVLFLVANQWILNRAVKRHKKSFFEQAKRDLDRKWLTSAEYLASLLVIKSIKESPINLSLLWGIFISSIALPVLYWYISQMLRHILGIVLP